MEIWKDVIGYEGYYQVSNFGNIKSLYIQGLKGERVLKPCKDGFGYLIITLCKNNTKKTKKIHIMVCESFLDHRTGGFKFVIDHIDSCKTNNNLSNLRIVTQRENSSKERTIKSGLPAGVTRSGKYFMSRITVDKFRKYLGTFKTILDAENAYNNELKIIKNGSK